MIFILLTLFSFSNILAQERIISGNVTDETGPLPGVSVIIDGTTIGAETDFDGNYTINAKTGDVLQFSYVGMATVKKIVGTDNTINLAMIVDDNTLDEVVVTAQGIKREKKALGYSVANVKQEALEDKAEADIARVLSGKVSGLNVVETGGVAGSGTNITIRGNLSITGNNQPLFVVNGVPFNTSTNAESNVTTGNGSVSASSRFLDLDPNSISNISVLKGLSATVLYGDAGRNGVILITTKTGSTGLVDKGFEVNLSYSTFINEISSLPDYQNIYGQGGDNSINVGFVGNWGGRFDSNTMVRHHYDQARFAESFPEYQGVDVLYQPFKNNIKDFFRKGIGTTASINASKSTENVSYNINFGHTDEDGYIPGNNINRVNFGLGGSIKLDNKLSITGSFNFVTSDFTTPPISANNGTGNFSILTRTLFTPRNFDLNGLPYQDPVTGASVYYRTDQENPLWLVDNSQESIGVNRFYNSVSTVYDFNDIFSLTYRVGLDTYTEKQEFYINKGGVTGLLAQNGFLKTTSATNTIWDHSFIFGVNNIDITENIGFNATIGFNINSETYEKFGIVSTDQVVFNFIDHTNFATQSNSDPLGSSLDFKQETNTLGLYGQLGFNYSNYLYLTLAGRNDWSSTIETENRSLFYPSVSLSFIPTSAFEGINSNALNYLKLRVNYGTSAGFPGPYLTRPTLPLATAQFTERNGNIINTNSNSSFFPNPNLKAELHREFEIGLETRLWDNKINLEVSMYKRDSKDQILRKFLDPSTGFDQTFINAGKIESEGIEVDLGFRPFKNSEGFQWDLNLIFSAHENEVIELPGGDDVFIAGFSNLGNYAIEGEPMGVIKGSYALRDDNGSYLINPTTGDVIDSDAVGFEDKIIGDPNPDWKTSIINSFSYKGFSLTTQIEYTHGGDFSSNTITNLLRRGVTKDTQNREGTTTIPGFYADPTTGLPLLDTNGNQIPNTIQQGTNEVYFLNFVDSGDQGIYDASVIRLREISLTYQLSKDFLKNTPFGSLSLSLLGQNLWFYAPNIPKYTNFDPDVLSTGVGNGRGLEFQTAPSSRKYGFSVRASF